MSRRWPHPAIAPVLDAVTSLEARPGIELFSTSGHRSMMLLLWPAKSYLHDLSQVYPLPRIIVKKFPFMKFQVEFQMEFQNLQPERREILLRSGSHHSCRNSRKRSLYTTTETSLLRE